MKHSKKIDGILTFHIYTYVLANSFHVIDLHVNHRLSDSKVNYLNMKHQQIITVIWINRKLEFFTSISHFTFINLNHKLSSSKLNTIIWTYAPIKYQELEFFKSISHSFHQYQRKGKFMWLSKVCKSILGADNSRYWVATHH